MVGMDLPTHASVVVIGGGVIGLSAAYHLAGVRRPRRGAGREGRARVRVDLQGGGRGARAVLRRGQHRARAAQPADLRDVPRASSGRRSTCTRSATCSCSITPEHVELFEKSVSLQNELGVPSRMIEVAEAKRLSPLIDTDGLLAAAYSPTDGHCTPESVVLGYAGGRRDGPASRCCAAPRSRGSSSTTATISAVRTTAGPIATDTVVCAAGPWSRAVGAMAGVDLPVTPVRRADHRDRARRRDSTRGRRSRSTSRPPSTSTREGPGLLMGMSDPTRAGSARSTPGCGSARRSSGCRVSAMSASPAAGPGSTR